MHVRRTFEKFLTLRVSPLSPSLARCPWGAPRRGGPVMSVPTVPPLGSLPGWAAARLADPWIEG
eukprot:9146586-Pyramimonas_sp.AAC.1